MKLPESEVEMPVWVATYYDDKTNEVRRRGAVRADTKEEADKIITDNAVLGEVIGIYPLPDIIDETNYAPGYTAQDIPSN